MKQFISRMDQEIKSHVAVIISTKKFHNTSYYTPQKLHKQYWHSFYSYALYSDMIYFRFQKNALRIGLVWSVLLGLSFTEVFFVPNTLSIYKGINILSGSKICTQCKINEMKIRSSILLSNGYTYITTEYQVVCTIRLVWSSDIKTQQISVICKMQLWS